MMRNLKLSVQFLTLLIGFLFFTACQKDETVFPLSNSSIDFRGNSNNNIPSVTFYGLSTSNELFTYFSGPPIKEMDFVLISGLKEDEFMIAIDVRPATKELYGVSNMSTIYNINVYTGVATAMNKTPFTPEIKGSMVGFDFDPKIDQIRLVTEDDQNFRIEPTTGYVTNEDFPINPDLPSINSIAYSYSSSGSGQTSLYDVDGVEGKLYRQDPIAGKLKLVGSLGLNIYGEGGFDISKQGVALAAYLASDQNSVADDTDITLNDLTQVANRIYSLDLRTGQATSLGYVKPLIGLAIRL